MEDASQASWALDQMAKSELFHKKLHEWGLIEVAKEIEAIKGEDLEWDLDALKITRKAWDKAIHRGVRPVLIFAHPDVLVSLLGAVAYYRMLSMVSQKSMKNIGLPVESYEQNGKMPDEDFAWRFAWAVNPIISRLLEADEEIEPREFDIWRGMAAGTQAQGSWQNVKGKAAEVIIKGVFRDWLREQGLSSNDLDAEEDLTAKVIPLDDGRTVVFGSEPDIAIYGADETILAGIEIKGGIDTAAILERLGACIKSLTEVLKENPEAVTSLIVQGVSLTAEAQSRLDGEDKVQHWYAIEEVVEDEEKREELFKLLNL